jgi:hypothetical protein
MHVGENKKVEHKKLQLSICDIGKMTFCLTMAKYLPMLPKGKTV